MAATKGVNSYVTVEEADTYIQDRLDTASWTAADATVKAQALVTATRMLDEIPWVGSAIGESQPLAFPRTGSYFDPRIGTTVQLTTTVPLRIEKATIELAYHLVLNDGLQDDTGRVDVVSVEGISLSGIHAPPSMSPVVKSLIRPLRVNSGANTWWRAN